jgi:solute carrier family 36 (proton-coupled amino acid transporter)
MSFELVQTSSDDDDEDELSLTRADTPVLESRARTTSSMQTAQNLLKSYLGSGILGLPFAFASGGLFPTLFSLIIVGAMSTHCMLLLVDVKRRLVEANCHVVTFADLASELFGVNGGRALNTMLVFTQFGFCCVYVLFVSQNTLLFLAQMANLIGSETMVEYFATSTWLPYALAWLPVFSALACIKTLRSMSWITGIANVSVVYSIAIVHIVSIMQLVAPMPLLLAGDDDESAPSTSMTLGIGHAVALMLGTSVYAFEGIGTVVPCETAIVDSAKFPRVIKIVMAVSVTNYIVFGLMPYLAFGDATEQYVTVNLAEYAAAGHAALRPFVVLVTLSLILTIVGTFPMQLFVVTDLADELVMPRLAALSQRHRSLAQYGMRVALVVIATLIAVLIPNFSALMAIIGAVGGSALQFLFPCAMVLALEWNDISIARCSLLLLYISFGIVISVMGTLEAIKEVNV